MSFLFFLIVGDFSFIVCNLMSCFTSISRRSEFSIRIMLLFKRFIHICLIFDFLMQFFSFLYLVLFLELIDLFETEQDKEMLKSEFSSVKLLVFDLFSKINFEKF